MHRRFRRKKREERSYPVLGDFYQTSVCAPISLEDTLLLFCGMSENSGDGYDRLDNRCRYSVAYKTIGGRKTRYTAEFSPLRKCYHCGRVGGRRNIKLRSFMLQSDDGYDGKEYIHDTFCQSCANKYMRCEEMLFLYEQNKSIISCISRYRREKLRNPTYRPSNYVLEALGDVGAVF